MELRRREGSPHAPCPVRAADVTADVSAATSADVSMVSPGPAHTEALEEGEGRDGESAMGVHICVCVTAPRMQP